jgi:hypothetical protein
MTKLAREQTGAVPRRKFVHNPACLALSPFREGLEKQNSGGDHYQSAYNPAVEAHKMAIDLKYRTVTQNSLEGWCCGVIVGEVEKGLKDSLHKIVVQVHPQLYILLLQLYFSRHTSFSFLTA